AGRVGRVVHIPECTKRRVDGQQRDLAVSFAIMKVQRMIARAVYRFDQTRQMMRRLVSADQRQWQMPLGDAHELAPPVEVETPVTGRDPGMAVTAERGFANVEQTAV